MPGVFGIDIASYQAGINIQQVVSEGYSFIFVKATEGTGYHNPYFAQHIRAARDAGALPGAYHFLRAGSGEAQAISFVAAVDEAMGSTTGVMLACDNEKDAGWATTVAFFQKVWQLTGGHHVIMYTGSWWWPHGWDGSGLTGALWHSRYIDGEGYGSDLYARVPASWWDTNYGGWPRATILQFSNQGLVAGRFVDVNYAQMDALRFLAMLESAPEPTPDPPAGEQPTADGDWNMGMSFDEFKNGTVGTPPPDWMGGPRDKIRMGDWIGSVAGYLTTINQGTVAARVAAADAVSVARSTQDEVVQLKTAVAELQAAVAGLSVGGVDVNALAAALGGLMPAVPTAAEVAVATVDLEAARMQQ